MPINCLMNNGKPITPNICNLLYRTALRMLKQKKRSTRFKGDECEGVISTAGKYAVLGAMSGVEFTVDMVSETGEQKMSFLIRSAEVPDEDISWIGGDKESLQRMLEKEALAERQQLSPHKLN